MVIVKSYTRREGRKAIKVPIYRRRDRPKSKKTIVGKKPVKMLPLMDEYGQRKGWRRVK